MALEVLVPVAKFVKDKFGLKIRINTNGQGNLIWNRNIAPELEGFIDTVSISLNNPDPIEYQKIVRSKFGDKSFEGMIEFAKECVKHIPNVILTTVDTTISKEEEKKCQKICDEIGATYRIREWEE